MQEFENNFELEWHGNCLVITPANSVEKISWDLVEQAAAIVLGPLQDQDVPMVVVDLGGMEYFGSVFLALLLRCHKLVRLRGGEMVLSGASTEALELLSITALDTLWAIYETRGEALEAVRN